MIKYRSKLLNFGSAEGGEHTGGVTQSWCRWWEVGSGGAGGRLAGAVPRTPDHWLWSAGSLWQKRISLMRVLKSLALALV